MGRRGRSSGDAAALNPPKRTRTSRYNLRSTSSREKRDKLLGGEQEGRRPILSDEDYREKNVALKAESVGSALKLAELSLCEEDNRKAHHTEEYEQEDLIVRRGQKFSLAITFDRNISDSQDVIVVKFIYGARPQESKGTIVRVPVYPASSTSDLAWRSKVVEVKDKTIRLEVTPDPDCNIGKYMVLLETKVKDKEEAITMVDTEKFFYVLFNAWCKEDVAYMEKEAERFEYVLNDTGKIWVGSVNGNHGRPWYFGQFETQVLEVALGLLDKAELADSGRNSAVSVIRCLSALTNSMDDEGLLEGRWTSEYPKGCTKPWEWTGSPDIIQQYHDTGKPVLYGQCWVFSGVVTTLLRSLGLPTRSVTNFASAHDSDCSMTIDMHFNEEGESIDDMNDSTWNFHVWNESFFRRIDLPDGYDGWQVHDATPQELSEGVMRCGPAPLAAVKQGHVYLNFDVGFIFSEVNGDKIEWEVKKDGSMEVCYIDKASIGRQISTKAVGSSERHDITLDYKFPEGSAEERKAVEFVNRFSSRRQHNIYKKEIKKEVTFKVIEPENCNVGEDMIVGVKVTNKADVERTLKVRLTVASSFYTGVVGKKVKDEVTEVKVGAGQDKDVVMTCTSDEYEEAMNAELLFKLTANCRVVETGSMFATVEPFNLHMPGLTIEVDEKIPSFTDKKAKVTFKNLTDMKLHGGVFHVAGSFLVKQKVFNIRKIIHPDDEISIDVPLFARRLGNREIIATFSSEELTNVEGEATVNVMSKGEWDDAMETDDVDAEKAEDKEKEETVKPTETKPVETKPVETKPEEAKPEDAKPEDVKPEEAKPAETAAEGDAAME